MQAGSGKAPVTPVTVRVAICALVWEKWIEGRLAPFLPCLGRFSENSPQTLLTGGAGQPKRRGNRGEKQGSKCVQVKGRVAFASHLAPKKTRNVQQSWTYAKLCWERKRHPQVGLYPKLGGRRAKTPEKESEAAL